MIKFINFVLFTPIMLNLKVLPYLEEIDVIHSVLKMLWTDDLEEIVNEFKKADNDSLIMFGDFAKRVKQAGYKKLGNYMVDLGKELIKAAFTGESYCHDSNFYSDALTLAWAFSGYAYYVSEDKDVVNKALRNLILVSIYSGNHYAAKNLLNRLKESGDDEKSISIIEAYLEFQENRFSTKLLDVLEGFEGDDYFDRDVIKLWKATVYLVQKNYEAVEKELKELENSNVYKNRLFTLLKARIESHKKLDINSFSDAFNKYNNSAVQLFPSKYEKKSPHTPMYG